MAGVKTALFGRSVPNGLFTIESQDFTTGSHFFVHSVTGTDGAAYGSNPETPYATIDYAIGKCTDSKGDIIHVMPGHAETLASATAMVCDVIGVTIRGVSKNPGLMPKVTLGTADTTIVSVTAAGVTLENIWFIANFINIAKIINVAGADCHIRNCRFTETGGNLNALIAILGGGTTTANRMLVERCYFDLPDTDNTIGISLPGTPDGVIIRNNIMIGDWGTGAIVSVGISTNLSVCDNYIRNAGAAGAGTSVGIVCADTATGLAFNNRLGTGGIVTDGMKADALAKCENYHVDIAGADVQGLLDPIGT